MKGPYERLKYDLRRLWECPVCHHRERTDGGVTTRLCRCQRKLAPDAAIWMRLLDDGIRREGEGDAAKLAPTPPPETPA